MGNRDSYGKSGFQRSDSDRVVIELFLSQGTFEKGGLDAAIWTDRSQFRIALFLSILPGKMVVDADYPVCTGGSRRGETRRRKLPISSGGPLLMNP
ncbi:MAG: hypothetical protein DWI02_00275 [Planctomycetota bacterium]|nr:MAG: hypothetical protein DWI02_00275 [Planctomycetota bacterium]